MQEIGRILMELVSYFPILWKNKQLDIELRGISKAFTWDTWYKNILHHLVQLKAFLESDYYYIWIIFSLSLPFFSSWWSSFQHIIMRCNDECGAGRIRNSCTISNGSEKTVLFIKVYTLNMYHNGRLYIVALDVMNFKLVISFDVSM